MFNSGFYPTPTWLARRLVSPYTGAWDRAYGKNPTRIIDTSAGKGDLLNEVAYRKYQNREKEWQKERRLKSTQIHAIEIEPQLAASCIGQGYQVVGTDLMEFYSDLLYDHVFMNPPFDQQEKHLLKSWALVAPGGTLNAIVSDKLFRGDTPDRREVLALLEEYKTEEPDKVGNAFRDAERKTDVLVSIIRMKKPESSSSIFSDTDFETEYDDFELPAGQELMKADKLGALLQTYDAARIHLKNFIIHRQRLYKAIGALRNDKSGFEYSLNKDIATALEHGSPEMKYRACMELVQKMSWEGLFKAIDMRKVMTSDVQKEFNELISSSTGLAFTQDNIRRVFSGLMANMENIQQANVSKVFDELRRYHEDNTEPWLNEGWKTNDAYRVRQKFILPGILRVDYHYRRPFDWQWTSYRDGKQMVNDIDLAIEQVTGERGITLFEAMENRFNMIGESYRNPDPENDVRYDEKFESTYFHIRMFKKGTVHFWFKDKYTWQEFNLAGANGKNWLPS